MAAIILSFKDSFLRFLGEAIFPPGRQDTASTIAELLASKHEN